MGRLRARQRDSHRAPGYTAARPRSCTALPRVLKENGYVTGGFGKWHLTPDNVQGAAGPFDHWPQSWGFDHWWGFLSGAAGQYDPIITQDNSTLGVPEGQDGQPYYFPDDLTDKAVPRVYGRSYAIEAELEIPETGAEGVIVANDDFIGGFGLWVDGDGLLRHTYSFLGVETYKQVSTEAIPTGDVRVKTSSRPPTGPKPPSEPGAFPRNHGTEHIGHPPPAPRRRRIKEGGPGGRQNAVALPSKPTAAAEADHTEMRTPRTGQSACRPPRVLCVPLCANNRSAPEP